MFIRTNPFTALPLPATTWTGTATFGPKSPPWSTRRLQPLRLKGRQPRHHGNRDRADSHPAAQMHDPLDQASRELSTITRPRPPLVTSARSNSWRLPLRGCSGGVPQSCAAAHDQWNSPDHGLHSRLERGARVASELPASLAEIGKPDARGQRIPGGYQRGLDGRRGPVPPQPRDGGGRRWMADLLRRGQRR